MVISFRIIVKIICLVNVPSTKILDLLKNVILTYFNIFIFSSVVAQTIVIRNGQSLSVSYN